jgi:phosphohistidine phosphatase
VKKLIVIRHAKSSWDNPVLGDFQRPLNERGERDAPNMGKRIKEKRIVPDLMLSSPAKRALTTCEKIAGILHSKEKIKTNKDLYHAEDEEILRIMKGISDTHNTVFIFGHNPGLTDFVNRLTNEFINNVPTCGVVACALSIKSWKEADWGKGKVEFFDYPKKKTN